MSMSVASDLAGKRFGLLTALRRTKDAAGRPVWECRCDCGNLKQVTAGHLNSGSTKSCGCMPRASKHDLIGKRFGRLVVLQKTAERKNGSVLWQCRCDCGNLCFKRTNELNSGFAASCGCAWRQPAVTAGERFGRLTALEPTEKRSEKSVVWKCRCDCGNLTEARANLLQSGHVRSCGCLKTDSDKERFLRNLTYQDDTCIEFLKNIAIPTKSSKTGVRGVTLLKDGKYQADLTFRKKRYYLGRYPTLDEATAARKRAEIMVEEYLEQYRENLT